MSAQPATAPIGARLGRYELGAAIASGGMATVYLARMSGPSGFEKLVALKRVHPHLANESSFVEMFLDEARIASRIQHPNVCQVFDFGHSGDDYYLAMEFLVGEPLSAVQRAIAGSELLNHPRRPYVCSRLIVDACEGLHAAHELRGRDGELLEVVHRDISPQNIFVTFDGNTKILDFGIASGADRLHQTSTGTVKGKFAYMAPEQANGQPIDRRADVFALGAVLWELLTFRRLFRRETPGQTLVALLHDEIVPPSSVSSLAPPELDAIVMRALARDPSKRYESARELGRDLLRTLGRLGDPVDSAEIAEWLETIFPDGRRRHEILLETARWGEVDTNDSVDSAVISQSSFSGIPTDSLNASVSDVVLLPDEPMQAPASSSSLTPHAIPMPPASPRWRKVAIAGALVAVFAFAAGFGVLLAVLDARHEEELVAARAGATAQADRDPTAQTDPPRQVEVAPEDPHLVPPSGTATPAVPTPPATADDPAGATAGTPEGEEDEPDEAEAAPAGTSSRRSPVRRGRRGTTTPAATGGGGGTGTAIVSTPGGWANVYDAQGRFLGETPLTVSLPAGTHRLALRPYGQPPSRSVTVHVTSGGTARVSQSL